MKALLILLLFASGAAFGQEKDTVNLSRLQHTYKTQLVIGSLSLASGIALIPTGFYFKNKVGYNNGHFINSVPVEVEGAYKTQARISFICAGIFTGIGIYSLVKGSKNRNKYFDLKTSGNSASLLITF